MMRQYDLLPAQIEYYQSSLLGNARVHTVSFIAIFDGKRDENELRYIANRFTEQNDVFAMRFDRSGKQYFIDYNETPYEDEYFEALYFDNEKELYDYFNDNSNHLAIDIFEQPRVIQIAILPDKFAFILSTHHLISDGFSVFLIMTQLIALLGMGEAVQAGSYEKHIIEELRYPDTRRFEKDKAFWGEKLKNHSDKSVFEGVFHDAHKAGASNYRFVINSEKFGAVREYCEKEGISVASFVNAAMAVVIHRLSGRKDFTIGTPILNRMSKDDLITVGLYMHVVPLFIHADNMPFEEFVAEVDDSTMDLFRHQQFTQYDIKQHFASGEASLFDVVVDYRNFINIKECKWYHIDETELSVSLQAHFVETSNGTIDCDFRYKTDVFSPEDMKIIENAVQSVFALADKKTDTKISDINLFNCELSDLKGADSDIPETTLYELFRNTAEMNPNHVAIEVSGEEYSYNDLLEKAELIAEELKNGESPENRPYGMIYLNNSQSKGVVGILADRSIEMYSAIYGVLRDGNAYMPVSPEWPDERIRQVLEDSGAKALIYQDKYRDKADAVSNGIEHFDEDKDDNGLFINDVIGNGEIAVDMFANGNDTNIKPDGDDIAYIIYTSGTTGKPKGAMISNRSAINRIKWMNDKYGLDKNDAILQKTPFTFDVSVWEIFWWAFTGARLCAMNPGEHFIPEKIVNDIADGHITHIHFVPSVFRLFLSYLEARPEQISKLTSLKHVFLSGEAIDTETVKRYFALNIDAGLHNLYGPTECAVDVTYFDIPDNNSGVIPIGYPISNTGIAIVDSYGNLLPKGMTGEIVISGANVGKGYVNNPELTEKYFMDGARTGNLHSRVYLTGDYGYIDDDNAIIYIGRKDSQIKINGQRVEQSEIENQLSKLDFIGSYLLSVEEKDNRSLMVLYCEALKENTEKDINGKNVIVTNKDKEIIAKRVREELSKILPLYMVPDCILVLDRMPLNQSGKTDRSRLHEIFLEQGYGVINDLSDYIQQEQPQNSLESEIIESFKLVLKRDDIFRKTRFTDFGANSLDIVALLSSSAIFDKLTGTDIMVNQTPEALALLIAEKSGCYYDKEPERNKDIEFSNRNEELKARLENGLNAGTDIESITGKNSGFKKIKRLYEPADPDGNMIVLFPYAAGGAESFVELVREIKHRAPGTEITFIGYDDIVDISAFSDKDALNSLDRIIDKTKVNALVDELETISGSKSIVFYSHCAGVAIAVILLRLMEARGIKPARYIAGASIPHDNPSGRNLWRRLPTFVPLMFLRHSSAPREVLSDKLLEKFKDDAELFFKLNVDKGEYGLAKYGRITTKVEPVIYKKDIFTSGYKKAAENWHLIAENVAEPVFIDTNTHYFQRDNAAEIADVILNSKVIQK